MKRISRLTVVFGIMLLVPILALAGERIDLAPIIVSLRVPKVEMIVSSKGDIEDCWEKEYSDFDEDEDLPNNVYPCLNKINVVLEEGKKVTITEIKHRNKQAGLLLYHADLNQFVLITAQQAETLSYIYETMGKVDSIWEGLFEGNSKLGRKFKPDDLVIKYKPHLTGAIDAFGDKGFFSYRLSKTDKKAIICAYERSGNEIISSCQFALGAQVDVLPIDLPEKKKNEDDN